MKKLVTLVASTLALTSCSCDPSPDFTAQPIEVAAPVAAEPVLKSVRIIEATGEVEALQSGAWKPARVGDRLELEDAIRTGAGGTAAVQVADNARVRIEAKSQVSVRDISRAVASVRLDRGRVAAEVDQGEVSLRIEAAGSTAVAEATTGAFTVFNDGAGLVAVAAERGQVKLRTKGGDAVLAGGSKAVVQQDEAPEVEDIPTSVFLKVAWPTQRKVRAKTTTLRGQVDPGTEVAVNDVEATVGADGQFEVEVPLETGKNAIRVAARDILGRTASDMAAIERARRRRLRMKAPEKVETWQ